MNKDKMKKIIRFRSPEKHYTADACVVWCFDDRFTALLGKLEMLGWKNVDLVKVAGGAKDLASGGPGAEFILDQIDKSVRLHHTKLIALMVHKSCGAYGKLEVKDEKEFLTGELEKAVARVRELVRSKGYEAEVKAFLADFEALYLVK